MSVIYGAEAIRVCLNRAGQARFGRRPVCGTKRSGRSLPDKFRAAFPQRTDLECCRYAPRSNLQWPSRRPWRRRQPQKKCSNLIFRSRNVSSCQSSQAFEDRHFREREISLVYLERRQSNRIDAERVKIVPLQPESKDPRPCLFNYLNR